MSDSGLFGALGLCRRAGKLTMGFDAVCEDVYKGKVLLVLTAADLSPRTYKKLAENCEDLVDICAMPLTQQDLLPISRKAVGIYGIKDENFARLCLKQLQPSDTKEDNANA